MREGGRKGRRRGEGRKERMERGKPDGWERRMKEKVDERRREGEAWMKRGRKGETEGK